MPIPWVPLSSSGANRVRLVARNANNRRDVLAERRDRDFGRGGQIHGSVFLVEETEKSNPGRPRNQADLNAAELSNAEPKDEAARFPASSWRDLAATGIDLPRRLRPSHGRR